MKMLSLDLEMNQPSGKIIQVGAVIGSVKTGEVIAKEMWYVDPLEEVSEEITELTGINTGHVYQELSPLEAYRKLKSFKEAHKCFMNPIVWGSGTRNDSSMLYDQAKPGEPNFMGHRVLDAKTIYQSMRAASSKSIKAGLEKAMGKVGMKFDGTPHRALDDALNTWRIWWLLSQKLR